jgi:hypothetical protein
MGNVESVVVGYSYSQSEGYFLPKKLSLPHLHVTKTKDGEPLVDYSQSQYVVTLMNMPRYFTIECHGEGGC